MEQIILIIYALLTMNTSTTSSAIDDDGQPLVEVARESAQEGGDIRREIQQVKGN